MPGFIGTLKRAKAFIDELLFSPVCRERLDTAYHTTTAVETVLHEKNTATQNYYCIILRASGICPDSFVQNHAVIRARLTDIMYAYSPGKQQTTY